jgi:hypothetical protein
MGYRSHPMTMATIHELFKRYIPQYLKGTRAEKQTILNTICEVTGVHRKAAIRKFRVLQLTSSSKQDGRGRPVIYTPDVIAALKDVWSAASEICGELLHPVVAEYVATMERDGQWEEHRPETTKKLLTMSLGTVKAQVGVFMKARHSHHGLGSTSPSLLKHVIPIMTGPWHDKPPGYGQTDTVVHCGNTLQGDMVFSVNYTDIATLWIGLAAQWNKGQRATQESLAGIKNHLPFPMHGLHPDSGSEFINWHLKGWCDSVGIELTRSRPGHKNDNCFVEERNGHVIRKWLGYNRLDVPELVPLINELYQLLEHYLNHFVPSRKCLNKERVGSRYKHTYDTAMTPYTRVLAHPGISSEVKERLQTEHALLNPLKLKKQIVTLRLQIFTLQRTNGTPLSDREIRVG